MVWTWEGLVPPETQASVQSLRRDFSHWTPVVAQHLTPEEILPVESFALKC